MPLAQTYLVVFYICVPVRGFMFIHLMFDGHGLLKGSPNDEEGVMVEREEADTQTRVLSVAQDLVYNVNGGKHGTSKHVGLASTLHQWSCLAVDS